MIGSGLLLLFGRLVTGISEVSDFASPLFFLGRPRFAIHELSCFQGNGENNEDTKSLTALTSLTRGVQAGR